MTISYVELNGSGKGKLGRNGLTRQRLFKVAWADAAAFCAWLTGYTLPTGDGYGRFIPPQQFPGMTGVYCVDTDIEPIGIAGGIATQITYPHAKITATYTTLGYDPTKPGDETAIRETSSISLQMLTLPQAGLKWADDSSPILEPIGRIMGVRDIRITRYRAPSLRTKTLDALVGCVNLAEFRDRAAGTMLFMGTDTDDVMNTQGEWEHTVSFRFQYRHIEWNKFLKPDGKTWAEIVSTDGSTKIYPAESFATILNWTTIS